LDLVNQIDPVHLQNKFEYDGHFLRISGVKQESKTWGNVVEKLDRMMLNKKRQEARER
jgi:hypothetical protein